MGLDFVRNKTKTFVKSWDRHRVELGTPDLFTKQPDYCGRTATAEVGNSVILCEGDCLTVEIDGQRLVAIRELSQVAHFISPPAELFQAVREGCGVARGVVQQVNVVSGTVEISIT